MSVIFAPYRIENVQIDGYDVVVNKPRAAAYRAPGGTNAAFAGETVIDELGEKLGMDPLEFRLLNGAKEGDRRADGPAYPAHRLPGDAARRRSRTRTTRAPLDGPHRGRGVACGYWGNCGGKSSASASVNADGTVSLVEGSVDIGGGAHCDRHAAGRDAGHPGGGRPARGGRHRFGRLHRGHRRQPHDLCHRLGRLRAGQEPDREAVPSAPPSCGRWSRTR